MKRVFLRIGIISLFTLVMACGGGGSSGGLSSCNGGSNAPAEATITITPSSTEITDTSSSSEWDSQYFTIVVKNENDIPLDCIELQIAYPWAVPSPKGYVQLYDGTTAKDSPMTVSTDENGTYNLRIDYQRGGLEYTGDFLVVSGSVSGTATFSVSEGSSSSGS